MFAGERTLRRAARRHVGRMVRLNGIGCIARYLLLASVALGAASIVAPSAGVTAAVPSRPLASVAGFPGPARGAPGSQTPRAADFRLSCNVNINSAQGTVAGTRVLTATALAGNSCGSASLLLAVPGSGGFHATFGIDDADTTGQPASARFTVLSGNGDRTSSLVTTTRGKTVPVNLDVSRAVALLISFPAKAQAAQTYYLYNFSLSGTARTLRPLSGGSALPAGARPIDLGAAHYTCNAAKAVATTPLTVTQVGVTTAGTALANGCGQIVLDFNPSTKGTLVLRYGMDDNTTFKGTWDTLIVRVLGIDGRLLRKVIGRTLLGIGFQELWVDVSRAKTVTISESGDVPIVVTAVGLLSRPLPPYKLPDLTVSGGATGKAAIISPDAFVVSCNVAPGTDDTTVGGKAVFGGEYLGTSGCGNAGLIMCCTTARGTFRALFGIPDTDTAGAKASVTVYAKDKDDHVLRSATAHATYGTSVPIAISVDRASVLTFAFPGDNGVLYDLRLSGSATISQLVYPPVVPPTTAPGGVAVNPNDFSLKCNVAPATADQPLVGATALEGWALVGSGCGEADLILKTAHYPHHRFSARVGILRLSPLDTKATVTLNVLNASGKIIRTVKLLARYGYGTQPIAIDLSGGATLQILPPDYTVLYAMTAT